MTGTMFQRAATLVCGVAALCGAASAQAALVDVTQYNVFILGSYTGYNSHVGGSLAAGGSVSLSSYSIGTQLGGTANGTNTLVAGGALSASNGQLFKGNAVAGGGSSLSGFTVANGTVSTVPSSIDFAAQGAYLNTLADTLGAMGANGATNVQPWGAVSLTGTQAGLNIFTVQASALSATNSFSINVPAGSRVLVNVVGGSASMQNMGYTLNGVAAKDVLLNFFEAGSLNFGGIDIKGSVLAPGAAINFNNGNLNGLLIASSYYGQGTLNNAGYTGGLLNAQTAPVPEPATWAMMIAGFGLVGGMLRRMRTAKAALA